MTSANSISLYDNSGSQKDADRLWGIDCLRILMCFGVIMCHFWHTNNTKVDIIFDSIRQVAVHVFTLLAFYFSSSIIDSSDRNRFYGRVLRLLKPYLIWPIIMFLLYNGITLILYDRFLFSIIDLGYQYLMGHTLISGVMYFNWIIILLTAVFWGIIYIFAKEKKIMAIIMLFFISLTCLYIVFNGYNYNLFSALPYEIKYPLGRVAELFPSAFLGYSFSHIHFDYFKEYLIKVKMFWLAYIVLIFEVIYFCYVTPNVQSYFSVENFGYGYPNQYVLACLLFIVAYYFPDRAIICSLKKYIKAISKFTIGIYCVHFFVGYYLEQILTKTSIGIGKYMECIMIFLISLIISFGISKIPLKWCKDITT